MEKEPSFYQIKNKDQFENYIYRKSIVVPSATIHSNPNQQQQQKQNKKKHLKSF